MPYVALKQIEVKNRVQRMRGEVVPEAMEWPDPGIWVDAGHVKLVPDSEIQDGRWIHSEGGGQKAATTAPTTSEAASSAHQSVPAVEVKQDVGVNEDGARWQLELGAPAAPGPRAETPPAGDVPQRSSRRRRHQPSG